MRLRDVRLQVYEKKLFHVFGLHFFRIHHDYVFRGGFDSVRVQFLSAESSITCNLPVQSQFISVNYLHVEYRI